MGINKMIRKKEKEMEEFSILLERLLDGEELFLPGEHKETLPSKIRHQLMRLSEKIHGNEVQIKKERDGIKELISDIAHQMRNPLANIESYMELLESSKGEEERQEYFDALRESEQKLHFLTESFIKMARLESGVIQIRRDSNELYETILKSILQVKKAADKKNIFIHLDMEESLHVWHDSQWLGEAVFNLLENSVKYSPAGAEIQMMVIQNEMYTRISVSDSGIGIQEGEESKIFQRFYRGKGTEPEKGFGLGLYLAREIVLRHNGFMKAKRKEQGVEISIFLL